MNAPDQLFREGLRRTSGGEARRYNLLAAKLIAELIKNSLGPRGLEKMFVDIMGEVTVTKDGATLLRKIDVEHPAAKVIIDASNAVDNEVGDGTTSVVVLAGALVQKAEELLDMGIAPSTIVDGYLKGLDVALEALGTIFKEYDNTDRQIMQRLVRTCLASKVLGYNDKVADLVIDAVCSVANFDSRSIDIDDIKIEEKEGSILDTQLIRGIVIDKTIDSAAMPRAVENAKIILINDELEGKRTRTDAEIRITSPDQIRSYADAEALMIKSKVQHIIESGANVVFSRKGINTLAQHLLTRAGIISVRRVKENDIVWLAKATGATISEKLDHEHDDHHEHHHHHDHDHSHHHHHHHHHDDDDHYHHGDIDIKLGYAERVFEKQVGDDKMVFVQGCKDPKAVTLLLRANSKRTLDECHRSALDAISVLRNFVVRPSVVAGGGAAEAAIAKVVREKAFSISGRDQIVVQKFAEALEEIPLTIARNAGMDVIDTLVQLRSQHSNGSVSSHGVNAIERKVQDMLPSVIEPVVVKEQVIKTAVEVSTLLVRVDDVLRAKPTMYTHTHADGTKHSHAGGDKEHQHDHFDRLGKQQRPSHHYY
jgi:chaperonin GroEL (HSP60 family)